MISQQSISQSTNMVKVCKKWPTREGCREESLNKFAT